VSRRLWIISTFAIVGGVVAILLWRNVAYLPLGDDGSTAIHNQASLPARLHVCGRSWNRSTLDRMSKAEIDSLSDLPASLVDPGFLAACPSGACTSSAGGSCATVIFVRVDEDAYIGYSLSGGP
jgi:hypothetical protein